MKSFENKVVIVTGGGLGIGQATSHAFALEGASVCIADINEQAGEDLVEKIKQFGGHGRLGGGVCGVEMALCDLAGKAYGVPAYMLAGGKYRDKVKVYADTPLKKDPEEKNNLYGQIKFEEIQKTLLKELRRKIIRLEN